MQTDLLNEEFFCFLYFLSNIIIKKYCTLCHEFYISEINLNYGNKFINIFNYKYNYTLKF